LVVSFLMCYGKKKLKVKG